MPSSVAVASRRTLQVSSSVRRSRSPTAAPARGSVASGGMTIVVGVGPASPATAGRGRQPGPPAGTLVAGAPDTGGGGGGVVASGRAGGRERERDAAGDGQEGQPGATHPREGRCSPPPDGGHTSGHGYRWPVSSPGRTPSRARRSARDRRASTSSRSSSTAMSSGTHSAISAHGAELAGRQRLAGELPDHGAQLEVGGEAQPVVDRPDPVAGEQAVAALAVGVVGEDVEHGDRLQLVVQLGPLLGDREVVLAVVGVHEPLQRPLAQRGVVGAAPSAARSRSRAPR